MIDDYKTFPHAGIQQLSPYVPGKSIEELAEEQGLSDIIKLASNENPRGCSPRVLQALSALSAHKIASYPIPHAHPLPKALANKLNIDFDMLTLSHGSDAIFQLLILCFALHRSHHIVTHEYAFQTYSILADVFGIPIIKTPLRDNWQIDVQALIQACTEKTALIFIANPNNPTGSLLTRNEIIDILSHIPQTTLLVLDEAYYEYYLAEQDPHSIELLKQFSNLVITRTFSKGYGLAGIRLGYAISHPSIHALLQKVVLPFTISQPALAAGLAALKDDDFLKTTTMLNHQELKRVKQALQAKQFEMMPSHANFVTFNCKMDGAIVYERLLKKGIIVRPLHAYGLTEYLRVTIGTAAQNDRFMNALIDSM
jgi:histidinol-phosphate aminotransferase